MDTVTRTVNNYNRLTLIAESNSTEDQVYTVVISNARLIKGYRVDVLGHGGKLDVLCSGVGVMLGDALHSAIESFEKNLSNT